MCLRALLPKVNPEAITVPTRCAYAGCSGRKVHLRQEVAKPLQDTVYQELQKHRSQCLKCKRTCRVYPEGTTLESLAYLLRLLFLDRWNLWHRLTRCR
jgi:hypothetical protein